MKTPSDPPRGAGALRDEIIGLGTRSLRKSYFGRLQREAADAARFRALLDDATDAILVAALPEHLVVDANRAARDLLGAGSDARGRRLDAFFSPPRWRRLARALRGASEAPGRPTLLVRVGGSGGRELEIAPRRESFGATEYLVVVARDVTERRRAARALDEARRWAEEVARARSEFLSIASHELRTPITSLQLRLELAARSGQAVTVPTDRTLASVRRLGRIVDEMLEVSRLECAKEVLEPVPLELRSILADVVGGLEPGARGRVRLDDGGPVALVGDPGRIAQVLSNLLDNALAYSPADRSIEARAWSDGAGAHAAVVDHGPGIPKVERGRLFAPFRRLPTPTRIPGLGLGLYLARRIARMHGGDLVAAETPGGGATFTLSLPHRPASHWDLTH